MPISVLKPKKAAKPNKGIDVVVKLSAKDHKAAKLAANLSNENLAEWISSLVNTALMP